MKVYLDDCRKTPEGWHRVYTAEETIELIRRDLVEEVSLDHDLGWGSRKNGYDVVKWIERRVHLDPEFEPPLIQVHSGNPVGRKNMQAGVAAILRAVSSRPARENEG